MDRVPLRLESERLTLREFGANDWPRFFEVTNTPAVMRWLGGLLDEEGKVKQRDRVEACLAANGFCFWLLERKRDEGALAGETLGFCGLKRADAPGSSVTGEFEIGWRLREDAWGRGFAKEAAQTALAAAFRIFGAREVFALTVADNAPSWGLMKRLGMRRREELDYADTRYDPPWRDTVVYSIDQAGWAAHRG